MKAAAHLRLAAGQRQWLKWQIANASCWHTRSDSPTRLPGNTCCISSILMPYMTNMCSDLLYNPHSPRTQPTGIQDTTITQRKNSHRRTPAPQAAVTPHNHPPHAHETIQHSQNQPQPRYNTHTSMWTRRTSTAHPARPPRAPSTSQSHRAPSATPSSSVQPIEAGAWTAAWAGQPTGALDPPHHQGLPGPHQFKEGPPRGLFGPPSLEGLQAGERQPRLDPPQRVDPDPDTRSAHLHQQRNHTPSMGLGGEGPSGELRPPRGMREALRDATFHTPNLTTADGKAPPPTHW